MRRYYEIREEYGKDPKLTSLLTLLGFCPYCHEHTAGLDCGLLDKVGLDPLMKIRRCPCCDGLWYEAPVPGKKVADAGH
ncbi:hypothetical protein LCGC14_0637510 [marine sediment metagenome]|uniref:Uncharacterized protein n=1 Tax=marine sediment metagenome TaxID=412755 RepID=A0A0F9R039_9ZZZZ